MAKKAARKRKSADAPGDEAFIVEGVVEGEIVSDEFEPAREDADVVAAAKPASKIPWITSGVLLVFVAGLFAAPWAEDSLRRIAPGLMPSAAPGNETMPADDPRIAANESAVASLKTGAGAAAAARADLSGRLDTLESADRAAPPEMQPQVMAPVAVMPDLAPLEARLTALESREQSAGPAIQQDASDASVMPAEATNDNLAAMPPGVPAAGVDLAVVTARLIQRLGAGQSYETELLTMRALVGGMSSERAVNYTDVLAVIDVGSVTGIATIDTLRAQFDDIAADVYRAANAPLDAPWWQRLWNNLKSAVTVRPTGDISGADAGAMIARAEVRLSERNVSAALAELEMLPDAATEVLSSWLDAARARRHADDAAHKLLALLEQRESRSATDEAN